MFTGIIAAVGRVTAVQAKGEAARLEIDLAGLASEVKLGDSVAVDGTCLTAAEVRGETAAFDVIRETLEKTTLGRLRSGSRVNLELALRYGDRLGGHIVTGHVDGTGQIASKIHDLGQTTVRVRVPESLARGMVPKGSVALDGISLTLISVGPEDFTVGLIPETLKRTTLGFKGEGDAVNIETDHLGKWVAKLCQAYVPGAHPEPGAPTGVSEDRLRSWGY